MSIVYISLGLLGLTGLLADRMLVWLRRKVCPWVGR